MGKTGTPDTGVGVDLRAVWEAARYAGEDEQALEVRTRTMLAQIERELRAEDEGKAPLKVPFAPTSDDFYMFCILLSEFDWLKENTLIIAFPDRRGGRVIGFIFARDRDFWTSLQALTHLNCGITDINFYTLEEYTGLAMEQLRMERGNGNKC